ncbi:MAG: hypothetical protein ACYS0G_01715 [Planctomycetota bacterium]
MSRLPTQHRNPGSDRSTSEADAPRTAAPAIDPPQTPPGQTQQTPTPPVDTPGSTAPGRVVTGPDGEQVVFISEGEFVDDLLKDDLTLPKLVLAICGGVTLLILAAIGMSENGPALAIGLGIVAGIFFCIAGATGTAAAWVTGKIFGEDFGSLGSLALRVAAVTAAEILLYAALSAAFGPILTYIASLPVLLLLVVWIVGMNLFQAFVFSVVLKMIELLLLSFGMLSIASAMAS